MRTSLMLLLAACTGGQPGPEPHHLTFGDATEAERTLAIDAATGGLAALAATAVLSADLDAQQSACPIATTVLTEPLVVRYEADDCLAPSGVRYDGTAEATNLSWLSEPMGPMALDFDGFTLGEGGQQLTFTGEIRQSELDPAAPTTTITALAVVADGVETRVDSTIDCEWDEIGRMCELEIGSEGMVEGLGDFRIAGRFDLAGQRGRLVLTGTDEMIVDFAEASGDCAPTTIAGTAVGEFCFEPFERPVVEPTSGIEAVGWGCVPGSSPLWFFDAQTFGAEVAGIRLHIATPAGSPAEEVHTLRAVDGWEGFWEAALVGNTAYLDGETTQIECPAEPGLLYEALDAAGDRLDCVTVGDVDGLEASGCR